MALNWFETRFDTELPGSTPGAMKTIFIVRKQKCTKLIAIESLNLLHLGFVASFSRCVIYFHS